MPRINAAGLLIIQQDEGLRLRAYPDPASEFATLGTGSGDPWTIGYGHTASVHAGESCSPAQALDWLRNDVTDAEAAVASYVEVVLSPNQFSALVSFEYNTGGAALHGSTLLKCVNEKRFEAAADQFCRWVYADGKIMPGLVARRSQEAALFLKE